VQCVDDEVGVVALAHRPASQTAIMQIENPGEVELAVNTFELGDIGNPFQIRHGGGEVATTAAIVRAATEVIGNWSRLAQRKPEPQEMSSLGRVVEVSVLRARMEGAVVARQSQSSLIAACTAIALVVDAFTDDMPKQMTASVLRDGGAHMQTHAPIDGGGLAFGQILDGQPAKQPESATLIQDLGQNLQARTECRGSGKSLVVMANIAVPADSNANKPQSPRGELNSGPLCYSGRCFAVVRLLYSTPMATTKPKGSKPGGNVTNTTVRLSADEVERLDRLAEAYSDGDRSATIRHALRLLDEQRERDEARDNYLAAARELHGDPTDDELTEMRQRFFT